MKKETKNAIKELIIKELLKKINQLPDNYQEAIVKKAARKPLHEKIFPPFLLVGNFLFQSLATIIGKTIFEKIARIIALENFDYVHPKEYTLIGTLPDNVKTLIDTLVRRREKDPSLDIKDEVKMILDSVNDPRGALKEEQEIVDIYLKKGRKEYYVEITTVKPNIKECRSFKRRQLAIIAIVKKPVIPIIGMPYNPYEPNQYNWKIALKFFTLDEDLLVGPKFWNFLGGRGTYRELLKLFEDLRHEIEPNIFDKLEKYLERFDKKDNL